MSKKTYIAPYESFLRAVRDTFQAELSNDAYGLYCERLKKFKLPEPVWQALSEPDRLAKEFIKFPILPDLVKYVDSERWNVGLEQKPQARVMGQYVFDMPDDQQCWATRLFPIERKEEIKLKLSAEASNIRLHVLKEGADGKMHAISGEEEYKIAPENFYDGKPEGSRYVLSEKGMADLRADQYKTYIECGGDPARFEELFGVLTGRPERERKRRAGLTQIADEPADYDDSDIAIGRQRLAQLERFNAAERKREASESDLSDV